MMAGMSNPDLIGTVEAAGVLRVSLPTMKRLAKRGSVPYAIKMPGDSGAYLFDRAVIVAYRDSLVTPEAAAS